MPLCAPTIEKEEGDDGWRWWRCYSPSFFSTLSFPLFRCLPPTWPSGDHQEKTPTITRFAAFFSFPFRLPPFSSPFSNPLLLPFFFFPLFFLPSAGIAAGVPVYVYRRNSMYILYARTPDQPLSCMACTFVRPDVRIVINTTLAFRTMRHASVCLAHVSSSRLCSSGAIDQVCLAECTPSYCYHSPSFFPSPPPFQPVSACSPVSSAFSFLFSYRYVLIPDRIGREISGKPREPFRFVQRRTG